MFTIRRFVISLLIVGAFGLIAVGFNSMEESDVAVPITDSAVKQVFPRGGNLDLRQADIGFQLTPEYQGRLIIDGKNIPDDQVRFQIGLNLYLFHPGPGTETGALAPGRHTATAVFWKKGEDESKSRRYVWTFNVH